jgi:hypothetical protein
MAEAIKVFCVLVLMVSAVAGALAWMGERPDALQWSMRIGGPILTLVAVALFLKIHFRRDLVPDYLHDHFGSYFNRDGFCFAFTTFDVDGIAYLEASFQNQYDKPCIGRIALRPARGFLLNRAQIETITYEIECAPAAFGSARMAIPIPANLQGKRQSFEVGASVEYPEGKGRRLRFHDGISLRANSNFGNAFHTALTVAGAATGMLVLSRPAKVTIDLPVGVAVEIPDGMEPEIKTLWHLGDAPLD